MKFTFQIWGIWLACKRVGGDLSLWFLLWLLVTVCLSRTFGILIIRKQRSTRERSFVIRFVWKACCLYHWVGCKWDSNRFLFTVYYCSCILSTLALTKISIKALSETGHILARTKDWEYRKFFFLCVWRQRPGPDEENKLKVFQLLKNNVLSSKLITLVGFLAIILMDSKHKTW